MYAALTAQVSGLSASIDVLRYKFASMQALRTLALTLLSWWVTADTSFTIAQRVYQQELPARILEELVTRAHTYIRHLQKGQSVLHCKMAIWLQDLPKQPDSCVVEQLAAHVFCMPIQACVAPCHGMCT